MCPAVRASSVVLELASLTRYAGHGVARCERAITAPFVYIWGLLTVAEWIHPRVESK